MRQSEPRVRGPLDLDVIMKKEFQELAQDYGEIILDSELPEGLLKEIPFLKSIYNLAKITSSVPEIIFAAKVRRFLGSAEMYKKKNQLRKSIELDTKKKEWLIEVATLSLNHSDRLEKCDLLGVIFISFLDGFIDEEQYGSLFHAVLQSDLSILKAFVKEAREAIKTKKKFLKFGYESLIAGNLVMASGVASQDGSGSPTIPTKIGECFVRVVDEYFNEDQSW